MPIWRRRRRARSSSLRPVTSSPATKMVPSSATSSPATRLRSVDFPHPDGPIKATNEPFVTVRSTPRNARTGAFSASNVFRTPCTVNASVLSVMSSISRHVQLTSHLHFDLVSDHRTIPSFHQLRRKCRRFHRNGQRASGGIRQDGLSRGGQLLEPLRQVHRVSHQGVLQPFLRAEQRCRGFSGGQPETQPEGR